MSKYDEIYRTIEDIQIKTGSETSLTYCERAKKAFSKNSSSFIKEEQFNAYIDQCMKMLNTKYEDPITYGEIQALFFELTIPLNFIGIASPNRIIDVKKPIPPFGTLNINSFGAEIRMKKGDDIPFILYYRGTSNIKVRVADIVSSFLIKGVAKHEIHIENVNDERICFCDLLFSLLIFDNYKYARYFRPTDSIFPLGACISHAIGLFTIAHEYSHYLLNHLKGGNLSTDEFDEKRNGDLKHFITQMDEVEADVMAVGLTRLALQFGRSVPAMEIGEKKLDSELASEMGSLICVIMLVFFEILNTIKSGDKNLIYKFDCFSDFLEKDGFNYFFEKAPFRNHPPAIMRLIMVVTNGLQHYDKEIFSIILAIFDVFWRDFVKIYKIITEKNLPVFEIRDKYEEIQQIIAGSLDSTDYG